MYIYRNGVDGINNDCDDWAEGIFFTSMLCHLVTIINTINIPTQVLATHFDYTSFNHDVFWLCDLIFYVKSCKELMLQTSTRP